MSITGLATRIVGTALLALAIGGASPAAAETVLNPGPVVANFNSGSLNIGGIIDLPFQATSPVSAAGSIDEDGVLTMPASDVHFPPVQTTIPFPAPNTVVRAQVVATGVSGTLDPTTGAASIVVNVRVDLSLGESTTCTIGTTAAPIRMTLTTDGRGAPYDPTTGSIRLFSDDWPVPGVSNCEGPLAASLSFLQGPELAPPGTSTLTLIGTINRADNLGLLLGVRRCVVPATKGKTLAAARKALKKANCAAGTVTRRTSSRKRGTVLATTPKPKTAHPLGTKIDLVVSKGPAKKRR